MQYEGHCPLCVYVGYTPPGSLDILTANEIAKGEPCPSYLRQVNLKQDKQEQHREYLKMNKQVTTTFKHIPRQDQVHWVCFCFCSLRGLIHGHLLFFSPPHLYVNSLCISGLCRLLHQPAVGFWRVPGGGPWSSEKGGRQTGPCHARESKGQRSSVAPLSVVAQCCFNSCCCCCIVCTSVQSVLTLVNLLISVKGTLNLGVFFMKLISVFPITAADQTSGVCCADKCRLQPWPQWWSSCARHGHILWSQRLLAH